VDRLLVSGIDSLAGGNLALALADRCEVLGLAAAGLEAQGVRTARLETQEPDEIAAFVDDWQPHWIVHCGPLSSSSWDPAPRAEEAEREPAVVARLAEAAERTGARLTVVSSDAVFCGPRMFHDESSAAASPAPRARWVLDMERVLQKREALVVRTHVYGWSFAAEATGFAELACDALASRAPLAPAMVDGQRHATPILATDLAELLWRANESRLSGLYHLAGCERTSPHRFVVELAAAMGTEPPGRTIGDAARPAAWHEETSLSSKLARRMLAAATPSVREGIERFVEQARNGWRAKWRRSDFASAAAPLAA
jgi:dTDP-4-dehydrorhamnose reductase